MKWVNSAGGPLLFLAEDLLSMWHGVVGNHAEQSDYDRACRLDNLIGSITIGNGAGIILNDEPLPTAWLPSEEKGYGLWIRWKHAKNESSVVRHLEQLPQIIFRPERMILTVTSARCILFDSALHGPDFRKGEFLEVVLDLADYEIRTGLFEPDSETSLVIHKFAIRV
jgi:hypothetical protein